MLRRFVLLLCCAVLGAGEAPPDSAVLDRPIRFVNDRVVTWSDVIQRNTARVESYRRAGRVLPADRDGILAFSRESLEELTDEELLVQQAERLQVTINRDRLSSQIIAEARERGLGLRAIATLRRERSRAERIDAVVDWFEERTARVTPTGLRTAYDQRLAEFTRPPRARTLLFALRPSGAGERKQLVAELAGLMRRAQQSPDPAIVATAAPRLDAFLAADTQAQEGILAAIADDLAAQAGRADLAKEAAALVEQAGKLRLRWRQLRTRAECETELAALRDRLLALPAAERTEAFRAQARAFSQGPSAVDGGLLGWVEPGTFGKEIEEQALAMPVAEPSAAFWTGDALAMVLVIEREEGRTQSFAEVSATLHASLDRERRQQARRRLTGVLRAQAAINDLVDLGELLR